MMSLADGSRAPLELNDRGLFQTAVPWQFKAGWVARIYKISNTNANEELDTDEKWWRGLERSMYLDGSCLQDDLERRVW